MSVKLTEEKPASPKQKAIATGAIVAVLAVTVAIVYLSRKAYNQSAFTYIPRASEVGTTWQKPPQCDRCDSIPSYSKTCGETEYSLIPELGNNVNTCINFITFLDNEEKALQTQNNVPFSSRFNIDFWKRWTQINNKINCIRSFKNLISSICIKNCNFDSNRSITPEDDAKYKALCIPPATPTPIPPTPITIVTQPPPSKQYRSQSSQACDMNRDGKVTQGDLQTLAQCVFVIHDTGVPNCANYDSNGDGKLDAADMVAAQTAILRPEDNTNNYFPDLNGDAIVDAGDLANISMMQKCIFKISNNECAVNPNYPTETNATLNAADVSYCGQFITPEPTPDTRYQKTVYLSPPAGSPTQSANGTLTITQSNSSGGFVDFTVTGTIQNLAPNTQYQLYLCGANCSSNTSASFTTNSNGSAQINATINHAQSNDPFNTVKIWEIAPPGAITNTTNHCYNISLNSPACLQANVSF